MTLLARHGTHGPSELARLQHEVDRLNHECAASMETIARERTRAELAERERDEFGRREVAAWAERDQYMASNVKLVAMVERLRAALKPFADYADHLGKCQSARGYPDTCPIAAFPGGFYQGPPTVGDCRRASSLLGRGVEQLQRKNGE